MPGRAVTRADIAQRIGVHAGEAVIEDDPLEGLVIGILSDVCGHARDGQVLVSRTVGDERVKSTGIWPRSTYSAIPKWGILAAISPKPVRTSNERQGARAHDAIGHNRSTAP